MPLPVAILWHMHQPHYGDPLRGVFTMPWVRLHAVKGYFDMVCLAARHEGLHLSFNLVPSLLQQIDDLATGRQRDLHWQLSQKPAAELLPDERRAILATFFLSNWDTMVRPYPRFLELLGKRGLESEAELDLDRIQADFTAEELQDLQTWGNLTWFGYEAARRFPEIGELKAKGRGFSEDDKIRVLDLQGRILAELPGLYRAGLERGAFELTTSPFYHPILPLLCDTDAARRAMPSVPLPARFASPESARWHVERAVRHHEATFGVHPEGLWPSEGSVSPEALEIVAAEGLAWAATDEGIRHLSQVTPAHASIYQPFTYQTGSGPLALFFRDRALSDRVGFTYSKNRPADAFADFLSYARAVRERERGNDRAVLPIILDGENAWEHYPDGGEGFLSRLYEELARGTEIQGTTFSEVLARDPHPEGRARVERLHSGSWIDACYRIWIGHPEKNAGWEVLRRAQEAWGELAPAAASGARAAAQEELGRAQGSDWFWWYGDDFSAATDEEFDTLFRHHVAGMYAALGAAIPEELKRPLLTPSRPLDIQGPVELIHPAIDGQDTHFYEWRGAMRYDVLRHRASMYSSERFVTTVYVGFDRESLYLRFDPIALPGGPGPALRDAPSAARGRDPERLRLVTYVEGDGVQLSLTVPFRAAPGATIPLERRAISGNEATPIAPAGICAADRILEMKLPFADVPAKAGERLAIFALLFEGDLELDRFPRRNRFMVTVPDAAFESTMWMV